MKFNRDTNSIRAISDRTTYKTLASFSQGEKVKFTFCKEALQPTKVSTGLFQVHALARTFLENKGDACIFERGEGHLSRVCSSNIRFLLSVKVMPSCIFSH